jgi:hypothetical protein
MCGSFSEVRNEEMEMVVDVVDCGSALCAVARCNTSGAANGPCQFAVSGQATYGPFAVPASATTLYARLSDAGITSTMTFGIYTSTTYGGSYTQPSGCCAVTVAARD